MRRMLALSAVATIALMAGDSRRYSTNAQSGSCTPPLGNPIACENQLAGSPSSDWDISGSGDSSIQGFATDISVDQGQTVRFKIKTTASNYRLDIYRLGYYSGMGARKVTTVNPSVGLPQTQPACLTQSTTGLIDCGNWAESASWAVPSTAVSGIYLAKLVRPDTGGASHIVFIVRDDDGHSDLLFQAADTTWQAYNSYGGSSLYAAFGGGGPGAGRSYKVSYNRPFATRGYLPENFLFGSEYPMVRWLEANGFNVSYFTGLDADRRGTEILEHKVYLSVGHDEYWSKAQRTAVENARAAQPPVHLAFFSGNDVYWKTRWETSLSTPSTSYRTLVTYKETHSNAKIDPSSEWTGTWRDPRFSPPADGGRPENGLTGTIFTVGASSWDRITVPSAEGKMRFWRNTPIASLSAGQSTNLPRGTLGNEWNEDLDNGFRPAGLLRLSNTTVNAEVKLTDYGNNNAPGTANHALTLYRASSGALVFSAGTIQWSWGLDNHHDAVSPGSIGSTVIEAPSVAMQQATVNLFADMGVQPLTVQAGVFTAGQSADALAPTSTITSPTPGSVQANSTVTITGTATDAGGGRVGGVEVSVDGGTTWHPAQGRESWSYLWDTGGSQNVVLRSRAVDDSVNLETPGPSVAISVGGGPPPSGPTLGVTSIGVLQDSGNSNSLDGSMITTGAAATVTSMSAYVGAIDASTTNRQYQMAIYTNSAGRPGTLVASTSSGTLVANAWNTLALNASLQASTSYWLLYNTNGRTPSVNNLYYTDGSAGQGVYSNASITMGTWPSSFPASTLTTARYSLYATVAATGGDTTPPTVTVTTPSNGATGVSASSTVTATFSEAMTASTITTSTVVLRTPTSTIVPATVGYNATTKVATLTPTAALAGATTYTATVTGGGSGVKDSAGNALASNVVWSFTTADTTAPTIAARTPATGATGVSLASPVTATFSEGMTAATISGSTVVLRTPASTVVPATVTYTAGTLTATLTPTSALAASTTYTVTVVGGASGVKDLAGNALASDAVWSFTTVAVDTTPPTVTARTPASGATGISAGTTVTATFSEGMTPATITASTVVLRTPASTVVPATVTYTAGTLTATLTPTSALTASTIYTVTVVGGASGVKDLSGNAVAADQVWSFTTAAAPTSATLGLTTVGSVLDAGDSNYMNGSLVTATSAGTVTSMSVNVGALDSSTTNRQYQLAIYTNSAGKPGTLVASSASGTLVANSWNTISVTASLQAGASYWLLFNTNGRTSTVNNMYFTEVANGQGVYSNAVASFGTWPASFPASTLTTARYSLYLTFTPAP